MVGPLNPDILHLNHDKIKWGDIGRIYEKEMFCICFNNSAIADV